MYRDLAAALRLLLSICDGRGPEAGSLIESLE
jgi:hypothetical protein